MEKQKSIKKAIKVKPSTDKFTKKMKERSKKYSQQSIDPFAPKASSYGLNPEFEILEPNYDPEQLLIIKNTNDVLRQCSKCIQVNSVGNGYGLVYKGKELSKEASPEMQAKKDNFLSLLDMPNPDQYGHELFSSLSADYADFNRCYVEIIRGNVITKDKNYINRPVAFYHVPTSTMRKTRKDAEPTEVSVKMLRFGEVREHKIKKHFRRYVQKVDYTTTTGEPRYIYFKEYGDPRTIDKESGEVLTTPAEIKKAIEDGNVATEMYEISAYEPGQIYSEPEWINQLTSILASKLCNEVNLGFFENNTIPNMVVMISGGALSDESYDEVKNAFRDIRGKDSFNSILFLEAVGDAAAASDSGTIPVPKLDIKPLIEGRQDDAIFQNFKEQVNRLILSSYRIDPILIGMSKGSDKASAEVAILSAEAEVFGPLRKKFEDFVSKVILVDENGFADKDWSFRFKPTNILKQESVFLAIRYGIASGALTPNTIIQMINNHLNLEIPIIEDFWGNIPATSVRDSFRNYLETNNEEGKGIESKTFEAFLKTLEIVEPVEEVNSDPQKLAPNQGGLDAQSRNQN